jgi:alkanesulfonate monooxygenase SsuD/methylene tetrahydromethanopterin reductase-like flavin-dependent oxidoreductase (luciferase family)
MRKVWRRDEPLVHDGPEIALPYSGPNATGLGKPLKSILHGNPAIPIALGTSTPGNIRLAGEIGDGWISMHVTPQSLPERLRLLAEGAARRSDGRRMADLEVVGSVTVTLTDDVKAALDQARPRLALYVGGMGAQEKNFHKDAMIERGYAAEAERIQELYLAGRRDEAARAVPDEFIDDGALIGGPDRIAERFPLWRDAGFTLLRLNKAGRDEMEVMAKVARR